ncbi:MAG: arginine--tRNA ligase [Patescibacteria group bacterium]|nr:arginine--tRNA ligase [Patescibacteria group bacterium]
MKQVIGEKIRESIVQLQKDGVWDDFDVPKIVVERPKDLSHGDWTTNVAFLLAKKLKKTPFDVAQELGGVLTSENLENITDVVAVQPGYINFTCDRSTRTQEIKNIIKVGDEYGKNDSLHGQKITVEYTQPNPFKPFHIGHLMSNTIGESLSRIIEFSGADVVRANYQGDVGPHVAKALWGLKKLGYEPTDVDKIGEAYAYGHAAAEDDEEIKKEIDVINVAIYNESDPELMKIYNIGRTKTLERFEELYDILGTKFDRYYFESETWKKGEEIVRVHLGDIFEESEGAIIFDGEKYGLHKRVFITTQGLPTYEAKELGLAFLKKEKDPSDVYVVTTAVEQDEYFKVVTKALELIDESFVGKLKHISHGMMQLSSGKMSSRKGNVITGESLIADAQSVAAEKMSDRASGDVAENTINEIAVAGLKFSILKQRVGKNIVYNADTALSFDGDSGPYIQYTYARCQSVIAKAQKHNMQPAFTHTCEESILIEKILTQFEEVIEYANGEYAPHHIANYLLELVHAYNSYYANNVIVNMEEQDISEYRVALTIATAQVIKNGMTLLGINVPEKM